MMVDIAGVNFALIQALEKRTSILQEENAKLKRELLDYKQIMGRVERLEATLIDKEKVQLSGK